jgi:hypothetical protein
VFLTAQHIMVPLLPVQLGIKNWAFNYRKHSITRRFDFSYSISQPVFKWCRAVQSPSCFFPFHYPTGNPMD